MISKTFFLTTTRILLVCYFLISCYNTTNSEQSKNTTSLLALNYIVRLQNQCNPDAGGFWARSITTNASYCVPATLVASRTNVDVYLENSLTTNLNYSSVADAYQNNILSVEQAAFGAPSDINGDGKVIVLILDIQDGAKPNGGFVAGFVDPINFYADSPFFQLRSNQREILYMDGNELLRLRDQDLGLGKPDIFLSTLAHELQHLIRFQYSNGGDATWIDEGTSEVSSDLTGYGPQTSRLNCFKGDTTTGSCPGGIGSTSSGSPSLFRWSSTLKNYAYAYAFMKYMYHSSGTNATQRNTFFQNTVIGSSGVRATNAYNFMTLFMNSANYNSTVLSSDNKIAFKRIFASFLAQTTNHNLSNVYFGNTTAVNVDNVRTTYPFPSELLPLAVPPFSAISNPNSINLNPSQVSRISGTTSGVSSGFSDFVIVSNGINEFLVFNGDNIGSTTTSSSGTFGLFNTIDYPVLDLETESGIVCPNEHLNIVNNIDKVKYNLMLYKQ